MTVYRTAEKTEPNIHQEVSKEFTQAEHAHGDLGQPFISVTQKFLGACAIQPLRFREDFTEDAESYVIGSFKRVTNLYQFLQQLNIDASASFSGVGMGASGSLNFARSVEITRDSFFIAAHLIVGKSVQKVHHAEYTADARKMLEAHETVSFLEAFGDQYCSAIHWGGELIVLYKFFAESLLEQQTLDLHLKGHYGGVAASTDLSSKTKILNEVDTLDISLGVWGLIDSVKAQSFDMQKFILEFPTKVQDRGYVIKREFAGYQGVSGAPPKKAVFTDLTENKRQMDRLAKVMNEIDGFINDLDFRLKYPFAFKPFNEDNLQTKIKNLKDRRRKIETMADDLIAQWWVVTRKPQEFDPAIIAGELPAAVPGAPVPLVVKVATKAQVYEGTEGQFVGDLREGIEWIKVDFKSPVIAQTLKIKYRVGQVYTDPDSKGVNDYGPEKWHSMEENVKFGNPATGFSFILDGNDSKYFDIKYEVELSDGSQPRPASNGEPAGLPRGRWDVPGSITARRLKVQVLSKIA